MKRTAVVIGLVFALSAIISAQTAPSDEQQIRALIAKFDAGQNEGMATKDRIFCDFRFSAIAATALQNSFLLHLSSREKEVPDPYATP